MRSAFTVEVPSTNALRALNYSPYLEIFRRKRRGLTSFRLGDLLESMGPAYGSVFTRLDCRVGHGIELISQTDMFASEPAGRVIRLDSMANPERHRVRRWQILIAGAGTLGETELYGRSIIADGRLVDKFVGPHAMVLSFEDRGGDENLYIYAFLLSSIGVSLVRSTSYGTKILGLRKDALGNLQIPEPGSKVKEKVAALVRRTVEARESYAREISEARAVIEALPEMRYALEQCGERKARCGISAGPFPTIAARNHVSLGDAQQRLARKWKNRLADILEPDGIYNGPRFARIPCHRPFGIDFVDQRDIFSIRPIPRRIVPPAIDRRLLYVPRHGLIVASHGQMNEGSLFGRVETAAGDFHECGITQDILRVLPQPQWHDWLYAYLSTRLGLRLLQSTAYGTSIPMMRPDLLATLPFPPPTDAQAADVTRHVQASVAARRAATEAEAGAVRIIEQEVLPSWLN
jgi:type I restriction enzyme S subunit